MPGCPAVTVDGLCVGDRVAVPRVGNGFELTVLTALFHPPLPVAHLEQATQDLFAMRGEGGGMVEKDKRLAVKDKKRVGG